MQGDEHQLRMHNAMGSFVKCFLTGTFYESNYRVANLLADWLMLTIDIKCSNIVNKKALESCRPVSCRAATLTSHPQRKQSTVMSGLDQKVRLQACSESRQTPSQYQVFESTE